MEGGVGVETYLYVHNIWICMRIHESENGCKLATSYWKQRKGGMKKYLFIYVKS